MNARIFLGIAVLCARAASASDAPLPAGLPDLVGPRSLALSASIGASASNEGIWVNPAAVGVHRRYSLETDLFVDRRGADTTARFWGASVVDAMSAPVAAGISYVHQDRGPNAGNAFDLVLAGSVARGLYLGVGGKYLSFHGANGVGAATMDAGALWRVADQVSLGLAGYNLVSIGEPAVAPKGWGAGVAVGSDRSIQVTADWRRDLDRATKATNTWAVGAEVLLGDFAPVRAGWMKDETLGDSWWSLGAGIVTSAGVSLDVGYRQSLDHPSARTLAAAVKVFVFQ